MAIPVPALSLIFALVIAGAGGGEAVTQQLWCVAKNNAEDSALQGALDWACGPGGADCAAIQVGGPCYDPNDLLGMASYAFNDYCLKRGMSDETCYFSNTAALTSLDPSHGDCKFKFSSVVTGNFSTNSTNQSLDPSSADTSIYKLHFSNDNPWIRRVNKQKEIPDDAPQNPMNEEEI